MQQHPLFRAQVTLVQFQDHSTWMNVYAMQDTRNHLPRLVSLVAEVKLVMEMQMHNYVLEISIAHLFQQNLHHVQTLGCLHQDL